MITFRRSVYLNTISEMRFEIYKKLISVLKPEKKANQFEDHLHKTQI